MSDLQLKVPLIGQRHGYDGRALHFLDASGKPRPHGHMACWYASAMMVAYFFRTGPRNGLPSIWKPDNGLNVASIQELASAEGLKTVRTRAPLTREHIRQLLETHGPLWAAGRYLDGHPRAGHVIVLTGVRGPFVLYNDPWEPMAKTRSAEWIAVNMLPLENALLAKDRARY